VYCVLIGAMLLFFLGGCRSVVDFDRFRSAVHQATVVDSIDPAAPVAGLPVDSVQSLRTHERVIVYYTDSSLQSVEGGMCEINADLTPCDAACQDTIERIIQAKLDQHSAIKFWRGTTIARIRAHEQSARQIILDTYDGHRTVPLWRVEAVYRYGQDATQRPNLERNDEINAGSASWWALVIAGIALGLGITLVLWMAFGP